MESTTYTMLVTIAHDDGAAPSTELLEAMIERGLEEGVREFAGVCSADVSAIRGDVLNFTGQKSLGRIRINAMKNLHAHLRAK